MNLWILAFESWDKIESIITAVAGAVVAIIGAVTPIIRKWRGKSWKEVVREINKDEVDIAKKAIEEQAEIIKKVIKAKDETPRKTK